MFAIPEDIYDDIDKVLIPEGLAKTRAEKIAHQIFQDYCGKRELPFRIFVIMNGAFQFYTDILYYLKKMSQYKKEKLHFETDFIKLKGYVNDTSKLDEIDETSKFIFIPAPKYQKS